MLCNSDDCKYHDNKNFFNHCVIVSCIKDGKCLNYEPKSKKIERINAFNGKPFEPWEDPTLILANKVDELIDAVNEIRSGMEQVGK